MDVEIRKGNGAVFACACRWPIGRRQTEGVVLVAETQEQLMASVKQFQDDRLQERQMRRRSMRGLQKLTMVQT